MPRAAARPLFVARCVLSALACCAPALLATAQDTYELGTDDTWLKQAAADPASPAGQLNLARQALARGDYERAEELADIWIENHDQHELLPVAYLTRGDALVGQKDYYDALFDYEAIARIYPGSEVFVTALRRELDIAKLYARGTKRTLWGLPIISAEDEAEELFIRVQERLPGSALAEEAGIELADFYMRKSRIPLAVDAYDLFLENYPDSELATKARQRLIAAHLASFKGYAFNSAGLYDARQRLREMRVIEPAAAEQLGAEALLAGIEELDARKMLTTARWYLRTKDPISAESLVRRLIQRYARSMAAMEALDLSEEILSRLPESLRAERAPFYEERRAAAAFEPDAADTPPAAPTAEGES